MDLHDGAIQSLYGLGLLLEDAAARIDREPAPAREVVLRAVDRLNVAIADLRSYVLGLRPVRGSDRPLTESLPTLAEQTRSNALLDVDVAVSELASAALDGVGREAAFYIAADALANIARHARAQRASVRLSLDDSKVILEIVAFAVGGQLHVDSAPGEGSRLRFEVPVRSEVR